jgi:hypothetical protein
MENNTYTVIGGQYSRINYGTTATLTAAKRLAAKNAEFWDNFQGWKKPAIYINYDAETSVYPDYVWDGKKWIENRV